MARLAHLIESLLKQEVKVGCRQGVDRESAKGEVNTRWPRVPDPDRTSHTLNESCSPMLVGVGGDDLNGVSVLIGVGKVGPEHVGKASPVRRRIAATDDRIA